MAPPPRLRSHLKIPAKSKEAHVPTNRGQRPLMPTWEVAQDLGAGACVQAALTLSVCPSAPGWDGLCRWAPQADTVVGKSL